MLDFLVFMDALETMRKFRALANTCEAACGRDPNAEVTPEIIQLGEQFLADRWEVIRKKQTIPYPYNTNNFANAQCIAFAKALAPFAKKSYAVLLMPTLDEVISDDIELGQHILSDDQRKLISIERCVEDSAFMAGLSRDEQSRIRFHSPEIYAYYVAIADVSAQPTFAEMFDHLLSSLDTQRQPNPVLEYELMLMRGHREKKFFVDNNEWLDSHATFIAAEEKLEASEVRSKLVQAEVLGKYESYMDDFCRIFPLIPQKEQMRCIYLLIGEPKIAAPYFYNMFLQITRENRKKFLLWFGPEYITHMCQFAAKENHASHCGAILSLLPSLKIRREFIMWLKPEKGSLNEMIMRGRHLGELLSAFPTEDWKKLLDWVSNERLREFDHHDFFEVTLPLSRKGRHHFTCMLGERIPGFFISMCRNFDWDGVALQLKTVSEDVELADALHFVSFFNDDFLMKVIIGESPIDTVMRSVRADFTDRSWYGPTHLLCVHRAYIHYLETQFKTESANMNSFWGKSKEELQAMNQEIIAARFLLPVLKGEQESLDKEYADQILALPQGSLLKFIYKEDLIQKRKLNLAKNVTQEEVCSENKAELT